MKFLVSKTVPFRTVFVTKMSVWEKAKIVLEAIKVEHTVFALPFAYLGLVLAEGTWPRFYIFFWVTLAMVGLRTSGMLFNRIFDEKFDRLNPRTRSRALPQGLLSKKMAWALAAVSASVYFTAAAMLNPLCLTLSPLPFAIAFFYPFFKRWTYLCHFGIGLVLSAAPLGGWLAARGSFSGAPYLISLAVLFWVAGFDMLYSLQDIESDRKVGLHSIPACFGLRVALIVAASFHALTILFLAVFGILTERSYIYGFGLLLITFFLSRQHYLIFKYGLKHIHAAFFTLNASVSIAIFLFTFVDVLVS